jgi:hypothetical protein
MFLVVSLAVLSCIGTINTNLFYVYLYICTLNGGFDNARTYVHIYYLKSNVNLHSFLIQSNSSERESAVIYRPTPLKGIAFQVRQYVMKRISMVARRGALRTDRNY